MHAPRQANYWTQKKVNTPEKKQRNRNIL